MAARRAPRTAGEWIGGIIPMGARITGEGPAFQPEVLVWLSAEGLVRAATLGRPGELEREAGSLLTQAMREPLAGGRSRPGSVRVASADLADAIRAEHPGLDVRIGHTPEIDVVATEMARGLFDAGTDTATYLTPAVEPTAMAALFRAAAALYRARPWSIVPDDQCLLYATCDALGLRDAPLSVIGQAGESYGYILFDDVETLDAFLDAAEWPVPGEGPELVPHLALSFENRREMPPSLIRELSAHRWETAGPSATPLLGPVDAEGLRPAGPDDVHRLEVLSLALIEAVLDRHALIASWDDGEVWERTFVVASHRGDVEVRLSSSYEEPQRREEPPFGVLAELHGLAHDEVVFEGGEPDDDRRRELQDELEREFSRSPEAAEAEATEPGWIGLVLDLAASYLGDTVATLGPAGLREVLFDLVPRKVVVEPAAAEEIVAELRAFYAFLGRAHGLSQAAACLRVLGPGAERRLRIAMADESRFGLAKSLLGDAARARVDVTSREWFGAPARSAPKAATRVTAKAKRKAARTARRKNR